jgi:hypothetical protein
MQLIVANSINFFQGNGIVGENTYKCEMAIK